jgi:hypothetical protein
MSSMLTAVLAARGAPFLGDTAAAAAAAAATAR